MKGDGMKNPFKLIMEKLRERPKNLIRWREFGAQVIRYGFFGKDINKSAIVRSCIRPICEQTAKARPVVPADPQLERLLTYRPNPFMTGRDLLYKMRAQYETLNTAFLFMTFDAGRKLTGLYPVNYQSFEALEDEAGNVYIFFRTTRGSFYASWDDVVVLRRDYNTSDISGDDNEPLLETLDVIHVSNESIANAIKSTANLRGIIKSSKTMVAPEDVKRMKDQFVADYMDPATGDGIGALDASMEFIPTKLEPTTASFTQMKELRENVYRYFGVSEDIVESTATPEEMQSFYELKVEPFLIALSDELTRKIYTEREIAWGNRIIFNTSTAQFMSTADKLQLKDFIDRGALTPNEWREVMGWGPVEGGDTPVRRLDTAPIETEETENGNE